MKRVCSGCGEKSGVWKCSHCGRFRGWIGGAVWWYWPVIVLWEWPRNWILFEVAEMRYGSRAARFRRINGTMGIGPTVFLLVVLAIAIAAAITFGGAR